MLNEPLYDSELVFNVLVDNFSSPTEKVDDSNYRRYIIIIISNVGGTYRLSDYHWPSVWIVQKMKAVLMDLYKKERISEIRCKCSFFMVLANSSNVGLVGIDLERILRKKTMRGQNTRILTFILMLCDFGGFYKKKICSTKV